MHSPPLGNFHALRYLLHPCVISDRECPVSMPTALAIILQSGCLVGLRKGSAATRASRLILGCIKMNTRIEVQQEKLAETCHRYHVKSLSLFGSATRADFAPGSDIDVLVEFDPDHTPSFSTLVDLQDELSALFQGRKVDLATTAILRNPYRRSAILKDLERLYAT